MKYLIISDIHGSLKATQKFLEIFEKEKCDKIICLGDILYHGPRNILLDDYNPKAVIALLNPLADKILACRGNCDAEVDQMVLDFPCQADYTYIVEDGISILANHGHLNISTKTYDIALYGHTHIQQLYQKEDGLVVCNPGSVSLPKENSPKGYAIYQNRTIAIFNLDTEEKINEISI